MAFASKSLQKSRRNALFLIVFDGVCTSTRRRPLLSASLDLRLLRCSCRATGTKFDLRDGQPLGPWCPEVQARAS